MAFVTIIFYDLINYYYYYY